MKPEPKREIAVTTLSAYPQMLYLHFSSSDAEVWAEKAAPEFGHYLPPGETGFGSLAVNPCFDTEEVRQYLESQGQDS